MSAQTYLYKSVLCFIAHLLERDTHTLDDLRTQSPLPGLSPQLRSRGVSMVQNCATTLFFFATPQLQSGRVFHKVHVISDLTVNTAKLNTALYSRD